MAQHSKNKQVVESNNNQGKRKHRKRGWLPRIRAEKTKPGIQVRVPAKDVYLGSKVKMEVEVQIDKVEKVQSIGQDIYMLSFSGVPVAAVATAGEKVLVVYDETKHRTWYGYAKSFFVSS